ncbi:glutathione S-transferase family protein [Falsiroseomonas oryzae]|uniref:glutathione S-transferase family protein n=1 Tax=Falsiroseomonas oryzae TaxID=2766473 RepID=UPI0022EB4D97|nr:glutathione S-transferase family protein [Roseomonas sp. MO-31]
MVTIYGVYRSRALRNIWLLEEMGQPFRHVPVLQNFRAGAEGTMHSRSPEYLRINPNGGIPAMEDDGLVLSESLAINLYLARKFGGPLAGADLKEEGRIAQWTLFGATEIEPRSIQILYNRVQLPPDQRSEAKVTEAVAALRGPFAALDAALAPTGFLVGGRFTVADINVAEVVRYALPAPEVLEAAPGVKAWLAACHARPAWKKIFALREEEPAL